MPAEPEFQPERRLHPWSWLFAVLAFLRQLIIPLLAVVIFGARNEAALWAFLLLIPIVTLALWQQWVFRYGFGPRGLVIHEGLVFRNIRQIEYDRIENIDIERNLLHRLLGVAQLRIETSTGGGAEGVFRVLGSDAVEELREHVFLESRRAGGAQEDARDEAARADDESGAASLPAQAVRAEEPVLLRLPHGELIRHGLIDNRGLIIVAAAFGMLQQAGVLRMMEEEIQQWLSGLALDRLAELGAATQIVLGLAMLIALLAAVRLLSVLFALVSLHDFTLSRANGDLRVRYGMFTRVALTMRIPRIQAVHQHESLLHRCFGRVSLRVDLAGGVEQGDGNATAERTHWLAPVCTGAVAWQLTRAALPDVDLEGTPPWRSLAPGARRRLFKRNATLWSLAAFVPALLLAGPVGILVVVISVPWAALHARLYVRYTRWALTEDAVMLRAGWLSRRLMILPRTRVQAVIRVQSPFDRRWRMASVAADSAGVQRGQYLRIPYLSASEAAELTQALYRSPLSPIGRDRPAALATVQAPLPRVGAD